MRRVFQSFLYKFQCGLCKEPYYGECARHLSVRIGEHIGIPITTAQKTIIYCLATIHHPMTILVC